MCSLPKSMARVLPDPFAQCTPRRHPGVLQPVGGVAQLLPARLLAAEELELAGKVVELTGADRQATALEPVCSAGDLGVVSALGSEHDALDDRRRRVDERTDDL